MTLVSEDRSAPILTNNIKYKMNKQDNVNIVKSVIFSMYGIIILIILATLCGVVYYSYSLAINLEDVKTRGIEIYAWMNAQNEFVTAGIGLWLLGVTTYLAKDIPQTAWNFIVKQFTVTLTLNNCDEVYEHFLVWYHQTGRSKNSRTLVATSLWDGDNNITRISSGYGLHFFTYGGKMFKFQREEKDANQTKQTKEAITLVTIGRSQAQFLTLIEAIAPPNLRSDVTDIYKWNFTDSYWRRHSGQSARRFDSIILPKETKDMVTYHIDTFLEEREWYMDNGIPYRTGIIFHGTPGSGKTSLVRGLCERLNKPLYTMNLNTMTDDKLEEAFAELPPGSIVLMEDIDTYSVTNQRIVEKKEINKPDMVEILGGLTLSGLLNAIDGIMSSDGRILIATTNHLEKLDSALIRKGRFNLSVNLSYLTESCFKQFFQNFYPNFTIPSSTIFRDNMSPAELQALIIDNREDPAMVLSNCVSNTSN